MKQFKIYSNPQGNYEAVKKGWSWPAFIFSFLWAMVKKMWVIGVSVLIGAMVFAIFISESIGVSQFWIGGDAILRITAIFVNIVFGSKGNEWREKNLLKRGYEYKNIVNADNKEAAIALYVKENPGN